MYEEEILETINEYMEEERGYRYETLLDAIIENGESEVLNKVLEYEGIIGYTPWILQIIQDIYNIEIYDRF